MNVLPAKKKKNREGDSYYFGDYGEVDLGLSYTKIGSKEEMFQDHKHYHKQATEYYLVLKGTAVFEVYNEKVIVGAEQVLVVEPGEAHWLIDVATFPCEIVSISSLKKEGDKVLV